MIIQTLTDSFALELSQAIHDFTASGDTFKIALYTSSANLSATTTAYSATNEVTGTNYSAGGETLTSVGPVRSNNKTIIDFNNISIATATISDIAGALIYNSSKSNRSVAVFNFNASYSPSAQTLNLAMPAAASTSAIIRIGNS
jgi:hypothetical protein